MAQSKREILAAEWEKVGLEAQQDAEEAVARVRGAAELADWIEQASEAEIEATDIDDLLAVLDGDDAEDDEIIDDGEV